MPFRFPKPLRNLLSVCVALALTACTTTGLLEEPLPVKTSPKYAAIVVDAETGRTLYAANADELRFPASLSKMMTLYLLFEALEAGRITRATQIPVSAAAASQPPTKIGFKPGDSIDVDSAIKALVVKSANDVATAVAEYFGGTEARFAQMMTAKARALGMNSTTFRNASGLPDPAQVSTARDMALLSIALKERFPQYYPYFAMPSFSYRGKLIRGHNDLLAHRGIDGIKTGYTRASGFNIATSINRGGRKIIAIVMGEPSAKARNAHVQQLVARFTPAAAW